MNTKDNRNPDYQALSRAVEDSLHEIRRFIDFIGRHGQDLDKHLNNTKAFHFMPRPLQLFIGDSSAGVCPDCRGSIKDFVYIEKIVVPPEKKSFGGLWAVCHRDKTRWRADCNPFGLQVQEAIYPPDEQVANSNANVDMLESYNEVEPIHSYNEC
jgi:hypothetical protein